MESDLHSLAHILLLLVNVFIAPPFPDDAFLIWRMHELWIFPLWRCQRMQAAKERKFVFIVEKFCANLLNYLRGWGCQSPVCFTKWMGFWN